MDTRAAPDPKPRKCEAAIAALLSEPTVEAAAVAAGVGETTLRRWLKRPKFAAAYRAARRRMLEDTIRRLLRAGGKAVETLERNLTCGVANAENAAARTLLEHLNRGVELDDMLGRIEELERLMAEAQPDEAR